MVSSDALQLVLEARRLLASVLESPGPASDGVLLEAAERLLQPNTIYEFEGCPVGLSKLIAVLEAQFLAARHMATLRRMVEVTVPEDVVGHVEGLLEDMRRFFEGADGTLDELLASMDPDGEP